MGVSGGSDSLALLSLLTENLPRFPKRLWVAHVNYGLRGKDSQKDEEHVRNLAREWGLPCRVLQPRIGKRSGYTLQEWARDVRYGFFSSLVKKEKAWGVAVAHHLEDQAETVLDRLLRGAGPRGLSGLRPVQELTLHPATTLRIWRPLLFLERRFEEVFAQAEHPLAGGYFQRQNPLPPEPDPA